MHILATGQQCRAYYQCDASRWPADMQACLGIKGAPINRPCRRCGRAACDVPHRRASPDSSDGGDDWGLDSRLGLLKRLVHMLRPSVRVCVEF